MLAAPRRLIAIIPLLLIPLLSIQSTKSAHVVTSTVSTDWAEWRGPARDGISHETNLPSSWSPTGENLVWKAPYGGRSTPIVVGDRLYLQNASGKGANLQERVISFNVNTGRVLWEHKFNVYLSDAPPHRIGWASPAGDPATGNVYAFGGGGTVLALSKTGKVLWERSLGEDFGLLTTHGGRTMSPVIDGDLVIVSGVAFSWGSHHRGTHRLIAFDKNNGEVVWTSAPGGRPYDTTYAPPIIADVDGMRLLIQGGSDGQVYAVKPQTGEPVWKTEISKRGINTGAVVKGTTAILTHSEENLQGSEMGMIAAVDATTKGEIKAPQYRWSVQGWQGGFSTPVLDGDRLYQVDNGANLGAFDIKTGKQLWLQNLGTIQKASPVLADGKLYVGTENGKFFILEPSTTGAKILDEDQLGTEAQPEAIIASVAVSHGRVFVVTDTALYAIGSRSAPKARATVVPPTPRPIATGSQAPIAHIQVIPAEVTIRPGDSVTFRTRDFDDRGEPTVGPSGSDNLPNWSLENIEGNIRSGTFTASSTPKVQTGELKVTAKNGVVGVARIRIVPPLPWNEDFESIAAGTFPQHWTNAGMKYAVREVEGKKVLVKTIEGSSLLSRARAYMGPVDFSNYTIESDVRAFEKRRQLGDAGVIAQRYALVLFGNAQKLEISPWQPETARVASVPFEWKADKWYRLKLQVDNLPGGRVRARGKAWAVGEPEPASWLVERIDPIGNRQGSPGLFGSALTAEVYFDNMKVYQNTGSAAPRTTPRRRK